MTNLSNLIEASDFLTKTNSFQEWIFGQANWACLSHRSLEGGTRVQQIIIGYFVAPISNIKAQIWTITFVKWAPKLRLHYSLRLNIKWRFKVRNQLNKLKWKKYFFLLSLNPFKLKLNFKSTFQSQRIFFHVSIFFIQISICFIKSSLLKWSLLLHSFSYATKALWKEL